MATKTFKIGLSNTDKQNMAQEVYERLLALTFPEYETTESYDVGDFVVYNDQLYKCIGATTGAWDSTKWQLATLNDLLTDIEDAVAFVNDKANVDGNYPTMTVGFADALTPYDSDSGDDQDEPFSFQATGTGNGTQQDFATGSTALMKEKRGNSVVVNQQVNTLKATATVGNVIFTNNNNVSITINGTANEEITKALTDDIKFIANHKYLILFPTLSNFEIGVRGFAGYKYSHIFSHTGDWENNIVAYISNGTEINSLTITIKAVDLTQMFNGDIPSDLERHPENFFRYYQGSLAYNTGELVNADGRYLKTIGRNQWDEEWELGWIDGTGNNVSSNTNIRSKNFIRVIPNTTYYVKSPHAIAARYYDKDENFISFSSNVQNGTFTIPSNAIYMRFTTPDGITTYNHDITISLYYEDESGYDQYYPYQVLTNNDTGTETLRSAGSVKDIKLPSGEIKRNVGYVDLSTLTWGYNPSGYYTSDDVKGIIANVSFSEKSNAVAEKYEVLAQVIAGANNTMFVANDGTLYVFSNDSSNEPSGYLFYELKTPTTEQGTPYSENLFIDDFGSMDFAGTNGVPQGNLIFYPVDYKAFVDTLYNYTKGTPSELAKKSDLSADKSELQGVDTQLLNAIGGTLRHCLAIQESGLDFEDTDFVDLGTLSWCVLSSEMPHYFLTNSAVSGIKPSTTKAISSLYIGINNGSYVSMSNLQVRIESSGQITIRNDDYSDATVFKNAMKGVLLAYEKAEE